MSQTTKTPIQCTGTLLGFIYQAGTKLKYLRVTVEGREYWFKVAKDLRKILDPQVQPGATVLITGQQGRSPKTGILKLKAETVTLAGANATTQPAPTAAKTTAKTKPATILVCQKSSCRKRGADQVCQVLAAEMRDRQLEHITIKPTGCLKQCKQGPNLVFLPERAKYSKVKHHEIPALVDKHLAPTA